MNINLRMSSIIPMLNFLRDLKNEQATLAQITDIFNHPDYDFEFKRHGAASKDPIIDYFLNLNTIKPSDIPVLRASRITELRDKHELWLAAYENPQRYEQLHNSLKLFITDEMLAGVTAMVKRGLPEDADIGTIDVISTMSISGSFGYVFDGAFHFDILRLTEDKLNYLPLLFAHEAHHLAMMNYESSFVDSFSLEEWYIHSFSGEGLAVKFCNNAEGTISKPIYNDRPPNLGLDKFTMNYLNQRFDEALKVFEDTLTAIRLGKMSKDDIEKQLMEYWYNFHTEDQQPDEAPKLQQSFAYSFGNDFFGAIYDAFGREKLFECVRYPLKALDYFKRAIDEVNN